MLSSEIKRVAFPSDLLLSLQLLPVTIQKPYLKYRVDEYNNRITSCGSNSLQLTTGTVKVALDRLVNHGQ